MGKSVKIIMVVAAVVLASILIIKGLSKEDDWICGNDGWVKHGSPSAPMPTEKCVTETKTGPAACPMDAKLCSDGSAVGRIEPKCEFTPCPKEDLIGIESPRPEELISSPLTIKGKARGTWYFEGDFPIKLITEDGKLVAQSIAHAKGEWMTSDFVDFEEQLTFAAPASARGYLVLEKNNPSDLEENADELRIPVLFKEDGI